MKVQRVHPDERLVADRGKVALKYGPLLYNIEQVDNGTSPVRPLARIPRSLPNGAATFWAA